MRMTMRVGIYARQSIDLSEGIDRQLVRCRQLTASRGYELAGEYTDNDTSATKGRGAGTAWARLLTDVQAGRVDVVVAVDMDRLLRSLTDLVALTESGAKVLTVNGDIDLTTADGGFRATMLAGIAQFETSRKTERQLRANEARVAQGRPVPGRRRYGYQADNITIEVQEANIVREMFERAHAGASLRSIAVDLTKRGVDPAPGRGWPIGRVRYILNNPAYGGLVRHKGVTLPSDVVEPIVPAELAEDVRAILADESRRTTPGPKPKYVGSGTTFCGVCGAALFYMRSYRCKADTTHPSITRDRLEARIREGIVEAFLTGEAAAVVGDSTARIRELRATLAQIEQDRAKVRTMYLSDLTSEADMKRDARALTARETVARDELDRLVAGSAVEAMLEGLDSADARLVGNLWLDHDGNESWDQVGEQRRVGNDAQALGARWDALDLDMQRQLVRDLLTITVNPGRHYGRVVVEHRRPVIKVKAIHAV